MNYKPISFDNLSDINEDIKTYLKSLLNNPIKNQMHFHHTEECILIDFMDRRSFKSIISLTTEIQKYNLLDHWSATQACIVHPGSIPVYNCKYDIENSWRYSLNIPISGNNGLYLNLFSNEENANAIQETFEITQPFILDTYVPYNVNNSTETDFLIISFRMDKNLQLIMT